MGNCDVLGNARVVHVATDRSAGEPPMVNDDHVGGCRRYGPCDQGKDNEYDDQGRRDQAEDPGGMEESPAAVGSPAAAVLIPLPRGLLARCRTLVFELRRDHRLLTLGLWRACDQ